MSYQKELNDLDIHIKILECNIESAENRLRELKDRRLSLLLVKHSGDILSTIKEIIKAKVE